MRPRVVINKGIAKAINAKSNLFTVGTEYTAVIYNPKDKSTKISDTAEYKIHEGDTVAKCKFAFLGDETETLKEGYATIEIYDEDELMMAYKDNFAIIRKNSLQIAETTNSTIPHGTSSTINPSAS